MASENGWPERPGVPLNPERSGWHIIRCATGDAEGVMRFFWVTADEWLGDPDVAMWSYDPVQHHGGWTLDALREDAHIFTDFEDEGYRAVTYLGPCLLPGEVAAREAAAWVAGRDAGAATVEVHADAAKRCSEEADVIHRIRSEYLAKSFALRTAAADIRTTPPPPDLSSALSAREAAACAAGRREGIEAAVEIVEHTISPWCIAASDECAAAIRALLEADHG